MSVDLKSYYDALERLSKKKTNILPRGAVINFDNVALEAGKSRGSIKANRAIFNKLRSDIVQARDVLL